MEYLCQCQSLQVHFLPAPNPLKTLSRPPAVLYRWRCGRRGVCVIVPNAGRQLRGGGPARLRPTGARPPIDGQCQRFHQRAVSAAGAT